MTSVLATSTDNMIKPDFKLEFVNEFFEQASKMLPGAEARDELQKSLNVLAQSTLAKLDLVTREEFDAQRQVLEKTRAKVKALESEIKALSEQAEQGNTKTD